MIKDQIRTLEALQKALRMELDGKQYYEKMSRLSGNELGRQFFRTLANEEDIHRQNFEQIYQSVSQKAEWPQVKPASHVEDLQNLFKNAIKDVHSTKSELESIQVAMEMENKTYDFYMEQAGIASFPLEKSFFKELAGQEKIHHSVLQDYYEYLQDPSGWFTIKERHSLDGG